MKKSIAGAGAGRGQRQSSVKTLELDYIRAGELQGRGAAGGGADYDAHVL